MNNPAVFSSYETADYCDNDFVCEADFTQFLEEPKRSVDQKTLKAAHVDDKQLKPVKKNWKSWKKSLFSRLKIDKKPDEKRGNVFETKCGSVSGLVDTTARKISARRPSPGPLTGRFRPTKEADEFDKVPYMCLGRFINDPHKLQSYGPVYLVT